MRRTPVAVTLVMAAAVSACTGGNGSAGPFPTTSVTIPTSAAATASTTTAAAPITTMASTTTATSVVTTTTAVPAATTTTTTTTVPPGPVLTAPSLPPLPPVRTVTPDDSLRVWVIGDSLVATVGPAVRSDSSGLLDVTVDFVSGSGLVSPFFFDWRGFVADRLPEVDPEAIVVVIGANDGQAIRTAAGDVPTGTAAWSAAYRVIVAAMMDDLAAGGARVYWVGPPIMRSAGYTERILAIDEAFRSEADDRPAVFHVDGFGLFQDAGGGYSADLADRDGTVVTMREGDGIHLTTAGGRFLAGHVLDVIARQWGIGGEG